MKIQFPSGTPKGKLTVPEQIVADANRRQAPADHFPDEARKIVYNEDALLVHPSQVFLNPKNSRKIFEEAKIDELAASFKAGGVGVIEPLIVRPRKLSSSKVRQYEVIAGDRRLLASNRAELSQIPIIVRDLDDRSARRINLMENLQREDLATTEMGEALSELKTDMQSELDDFLKANDMLSETPKSLPMGVWDAIKAANAATAPEWLFPVVERAMNMQRAHSPRVTWQDVAKEVGLKERSVYYYVAIADLPEEIQEAVSELSQQQSRAITQLKDPEQQKQLLEEIQEHNLTGEDALERAREIAGKAKTPAKPSKKGGADSRSGKGTSASLTQNSQIREFRLALKENRNVVATTRRALEARVGRFGPLDAQSRMELRDTLKELREELEAMEALTAPLSAATREAA